MMKTAICSFAGLLLASTIATAQSDVPLSPPAGAVPIEGDAIKALLGNKDYNFFGAGDRVTGTGYWDTNTGTAYGTFELDGRIKGRWSNVWFVDGNKNCLKFGETKTVCTYIYRYGDDGFLEVNLDGTVHTIYRPTQRQLLPVPLSASEVEDLFNRLFVWTQESGTSVDRVEMTDQGLTVHLVGPDGKSAGSRLIDPTTGATHAVGQ